MLRLMVREHDYPWHYTTISESPLDITDPNIQEWIDNNKDTLLQYKSSSETMDEFKNRVVIAIDFKSLKLSL